MSLSRSGLIALGALITAYGAWLLLSRLDGEQLLSAGFWLIGGVLVHDAAIAVATIGVAAVGARLLPASAHAPAAVGLLLIGSITLVAIPVLGSFADPDNPTLLDRNYWVGWLIIVGLVATGMIIASWRRSAQVRRS